MPETVGALIVAEIGLEVSATVSAAIGYTVVTAGTLALQYAAQALLGHEKQANQQVTVRQAVGPRRRGHGRDKLGGTIHFFDTAPFGDKNKILTRGVVYCVGPVTAIREYWLGDIRTGLQPGAGGLVPDAVYQGKVAIEGYVGTETQAASPACLRFSYWGADCQLKGLAYSVVVATPLKHGSEIFPEGTPDVRIVTDLVACYDPRNAAHAPGNPDTWSWSDNAAIVLLDYLTHDSGYGIPLSEIDLDSFKALADVCDEVIPLVVADPNGATSEPRYRSWGSYTYDEERATVLARYLAACDAELFQDGQGRVAVRGGRWQAPTFVIDESMVLGWGRIEREAEEPDTFTRVKHTYTSPFHDYQPVEGDPYDDLAAQDRQGIVSTERDFRRSPSHSQSRRLAKIALHKGRPPIRVTDLRLTPAALGAWGEPTVTLRLPSLGIEVDCAVGRGRLPVGPLSSFTLDLSALGPEAYAWDPAEEGQRPPLPDTYN